MGSSTWENIRGLVIFFGPILLPKAISYYRQVRNAPRAQGISIQPLPPSVSRALTVLFGVALLLLALTLPVFSPENVFTATQSRLQIPPDVLFNRLSTLRPNETLTPSDEALRARFVNMESRLLYLKYGPDVLTGCTFCTSEDPKVYYFYALPSLLAPHLFNLFAIALVTSRPLSQTYGGKWRRPATMAAIALAALDLYLVNSYNYQLNARALRVGEIDFFYWRARVYRLLVLAALDGLLGWLMYLSSTHRAFVDAPSPAVRAEAVVLSLSKLKAKLNALGTVMNTVSRDDELRRQNAAYWVQEGNLMRTVMEEREVIESVNNALENGRLNVSAISKDAESYAEHITANLKAAEEKKNK
ncbi:hypothetical protein SAPIO_CDS1029 [Scedosporium apiospermum]|uniref:Chorismate synthase protein n=1 Tax=Pseudallescheria apiosperma TaxID=563466 RepID=A0A084GFP8_PSEDA|nr:uncharacterized protein SAPIO_CDS1029 [Scedosporium apiospermum]KEZ46160.1 hypothetical protein SAPIO_CDS1029 [Scedosporium apiospermum]